MVYRHILAPPAPWPMGHLRWVLAQVELVVAGPPERDPHGCEADCGDCQEDDDEPAIVVEVLAFAGKVVHDVPAEVV